MSSLRNCLALVAAVLASASGAQNLVPNGSFEEILACPNSLGQLFKAVQWHKGGVGSPDLFNVCDGNDTCGVPQNFFGYQAPATGNGYCGMWAYSNATGGYGTHEIIGARLTEELIIGQTYWASIRVSWTSSYPSPLVLTRYATDKIGVLMKMDSTYGEPSWLPWPDHAHVYDDQVISDSLGWTLVQGFFVADSAYKFIYVGNFFADDQTEALLVDPNGNTDISYYYVDDVCLSSNPADCGLDMSIQSESGSFGYNVWVDGAGVCHVSGLQSAVRLLVELFDARGQLVLSTSSTLQSDALPVSVGLFSPGLYILRLTTDRLSRSFPVRVPTN